MASLVTVLMFIVFGSMMILKKAAATSALGDECQEKCGKISIPQPFGIAQGCYRPGFRLRCNNNTGKTPRLFLDGDGASRVEITGISVSLSIVFIQNYLLASMNTSTDISSISWRALENTPYTLLSGGVVIYTQFVASGCDVSAYLVDLNRTIQNKDDVIVASCSTICKGKDDAISFINRSYDYCNGTFCCKMSIPAGLKYYEIRLMRSNQTSTWKKTPSWAFVGDPGQNVPSINVPKSVSATLTWTIDDQQTCDAARKKTNTYACGPNTQCTDQDDNKGYNCQCTQGYEGNPYDKPHGCQDIDECKTPEKYGCNGKCINVPGAYECVCPPQTQGDPRKACYPVKKSPVVLVIIIGVSTSAALLLLFLSIYFLHQRWKKRIVRRIKEKHFRKNRGLFLQQLLSSNNDLAERTKIFPLEELEKATNNFDATRILGHGGHGTVYKGILADQRIAAIKKAKIAKQKEIDEFINEVVILSQINHKNVVRLFGCCLESEVPLLVYEFVPNGTLNDHLERHSSLTWEERLRIAAEASGALAYLHSSTSISIFHRDVKSSNILLDDNCSAKVSDFGASRSLPSDQTHLTMSVQGTFGYLDPEYYQTGQLTEKSDVYSFGVILLELLTGEKPISSARCTEEINLCSRFLCARGENRLFQIFEGRVKEEGTKEELTTIAKLAEMCLQLRRDERPTMKEVEGILEGLRRSKNRKQQSGTGRHCGQTEDLRSVPSSYALYELVEGSEVTGRKNLDSSRVFSMEKEFMLSLDCPR